MGNWINNLNWKKNDKEERVKTDRMGKEFRVCKTGGYWKEQARPLKNGEIDEEEDWIEPSRRGYRNKFESKKEAKAFIEGIIYWDRFIG